MCIYDGECLFGNIIDREMQLNECGEIVQGEWLRTSTVRPNVTLDAFVVMPNHIHGIIMLTKDTVGATRWVAQSKHQIRIRATHRVAPTGPVSGSIGAIIGQMKSLAAKRINHMRKTPGAAVWQRNYYEHVIRDDPDLNRVREYIANNPARWDEDENNPTLNTTHIITKNVR
jgi:REP element-mobilizing transposase RayT